MPLILLIFSAARENTQLNMLEIKLFQMCDRQVHFIFFEKERIQHMKQEHFLHLTERNEPEETGRHFTMSEHSAKQGAQIQTPDRKG